MTDVLLYSVLVGISLCADCFAVALCSAVSVDLVQARRKAGKVALVFAVMQTGLLLAGWIAASLFTDYLQSRFSGFTTVARWLGFLILLYVGGMMVVESLKGETGHLSLSGFKSIFLGGVATSIDALAVGASFGLEGQGWEEILPLSVSVFFFTALSVIVGMIFGSALGTRFGKPVRIAGGLILMALGVHVLF